MHTPPCPSGHSPKHVPELHVPHDSPTAVQVGRVVVEVVVVAVVAVVAVWQPGVPGAGHTSQQLAQVPSVPRQCAASFLTLHFVPVVVVIQQVTDPAGLPQTERAAQPFTLPRQLRF